MYEQLLNVFISHVEKVVGFRNPIYSCIISRLSALAALETLKRLDLRVLLYQTDLIKMYPCIKI